MNSNIIDIERNYLELVESIKNNHNHNSIDIINACVEERALSDHPITTILQLSDNSLNLNLTGELNQGVEINGKKIFILFAKIDNKTYISMDARCGSIKMIYVKSVLGHSHFLMSEPYFDNTGTRVVEDD